jgi:pimeloyl-ACP methyl ester carboxylesterase
MAGDATFEAFAADADRLERLLGNAEWFFEVDMPEVVRYLPNARALATTRVPVIALAGAASRGQPLYETARWVAQQLGSEVVELPGGHAGYMERPAEAAAILRPILERWS